ncbi:putative iron-regulated membrane protein [Promicromonospora umidemergens]|uniref:PepSY-associated TM helix domain-containing protein n=1 Tax=Promicromonospora umidemergens TaxID=629679 RepID=A0ABP8XK41_9MICO|nr:PepSY-associated TM helix domain-containing protein [Promicromonospora umidemergens]MCP2285623.1 putative iron-regulated membrane protein [Promicromonospora umidemergens]
MTETLVDRTSTRPGETYPSLSSRGRRPWFGPLLRRLHFYAGILVGPFILVAATSGALYALTPALEQVVYDHELHAPATDASVPLDEQVEIAQTHIGEGAALTAVRPAPGAGDTTRVMFAQDGLGPSESRAVFVDPGTGEVRGDLVTYGSSGALPLRAWVSDLHRSLHLGDPGRLYSELAASWLGIVATAGLVLWINRLRASRRAARSARPKARRTGYRRVLSWHTTVGAVVVLGALFLSATGITWSQHGGANVGELRTSLGWLTPSVSTSLADDAPDAGDGHAGHGGAPGADLEASDAAAFGAVLAVAQQVNVNTGEVEIKPPAGPGTAWVVQETKSSFPTEGDSVAIDETTMQVVDRADVADFPLAAKLSTWGVDLHMGLLFGLANQLVLFVLALGIGSMVVLGYLMWWKRRPTREPQGLGGPPPARGALRGAPWWGVVAVAAGAVAVGWFLPLVGYTLVAFLVVDLLAGMARARRERSPV